MRVMLFLRLITNTGTCIIFVQLTVVNVSPVADVAVKVLMSIDIIITIY